jgi:hypothetical protein
MGNSCIYHTHQWCISPCYSLYSIWMVVYKPSQWLKCKGSAPSHLFDYSAHIKYQIEIYNFIFFKCCILLYNNNNNNIREQRHWATLSLHKNMSFPFLFFFYFFFFLLLLSVCSFNCQTYCFGPISYTLADYACHICARQIWATVCLD